MHWIVATLFASGLSTTVNFVDKYVIEAKVKDYRGMIVYTSLVGFLFGSLWWIFSGFPVLGTRDATLVLLTGALIVWSMTLYFKALSLETTSIIILFFQITPVLVLVLAFIFLGETLNIRQVIGFVLIFFAVTAVSLQRKSFDGNWISLPFLYIFLASFLVAIAATIIKFTTQTNSFSSVLCYESWGVGIGGLLLFLIFPSIRRAFFGSFRTIGRRVLMIVFVNELIFVFSKALLIYAYSIGPAALVSVLSGVSVLFGIILGLILTFFAPFIFREESSSGGIMKKVLLGIVALVGIWCIQS